MGGGGWGRGGGRGGGGLREKHEEREGNKYCAKTNVCLKDILFENNYCFKSNIVLKQYFFLYFCILPT